MYSWALRTQRRSFMHMATLVEQLGHLQGQRSLIDQLESFPWQSLSVLNEIKVFKTQAVTLKVRQKGECSFESSVKFEIIHQIVHHKMIEIWNVTENEFLLL